MRALAVAEDGPPERALELQYLVPDTLAKPDRIFPYVADGWDGWCFATKAAYRMRSDGVRIAASPRDVFVAFVTSGLLITDWGWEVSDPRDACPPVRHDERLGAAVYTREQS